MTSTQKNHLILLRSYKKTQITLQSIPIVCTVKQPITPICLLHDKTGISV